MVGAHVVAEGVIDAFNGARSLSVRDSRVGPAREWLKVKVRHEGRFGVVGLDVPRADNCSLLLAARQGRRLVYVGRVEWGVSRRIIAELRERCTLLSSPVCEGVERSRSVVRIHPDTIAEVQYNELMQGWLRDAVLGGVTTNR
jgi:bifunctional non-homologous end joining protein LigD